MWVILKIILDEVLSAIGKNLHTIRNGKGETLQMVAKEIEISHPVLSQIENGRYHSLGLSQIVSLCNHYNMTIDEVLQLQDNKVFHFNQKNETGANNAKQMFKDSSEGYLKCIEKQDEQINYLKQQLDKKG